MGSKSRCNVMVGVVMVMLTVTACSSPPSELRWPPAAPSSSPSTANVWLGSPTTLVCRVADDVDEGMGVYYLEVHSAAFDFSPCNSGAARIPVHLGDPQGFFGDGMQLQKRCMYGGATDARVNGYVNVMSSAKPFDLVAANRLCTAHHGVSHP